MNKSTTETIDRFLRLDEVLHTTGLGRNTVYRRIREGTFPKQVRIGPNSVAWRQSAIAQWMIDLPPATTNQYIDQYTKNNSSRQTL
jgi:prophage regulatory protein